jgi:uncharacterized membrane protein YhaH (DUF805 family)
MTLRELLFSFTGRIGRASYWLVMVLMSAVLVAITLAFEFFTASSSGLSTTLVVSVSAAVVIAALAILVPALAVSAKRLHDRDKSALWILFFWLGPGLIQILGRRLLDENTQFVTAAIAWVIFLWMLVELGILRGTIGPNQYGPDPLQKPN